jgi:hypothetical protein
MPSTDEAAGAAPSGEALERVILDLLDQRATTSTICPSDAARAVGGDDWRPLMQPVRDAAQRLVERGEAEITQGGEVVQLDSVKGPIRIRRRPTP